MKTFIIVTHVPLITAVMRQEAQFPLWIEQAVPFFWIISAFLFNLAFYRHGSTSPQNELCKKRLWPRLTRILVPYCTIFALMLIVTLYASDVFSTATMLTGMDIPARKLMFIPAILIDFICGGPGPGGYYIPMLFQMYLLLPFMCYFYKRKPIITIIGSTFVIAIWEIAAAANIVSPQIYRLILIRYGLYLLAGIAISNWYIHHTEASLKHLLISISMTIVGGLYLVAINDWGMPPLSGTAWQNTSTLSFAYVAGIIAILIALSYRLGKPDLLGLDEHPPPITRFQAFFEAVSKAALHIYMFQMLYFYAMPSSLFVAMGLKLSIIASVFICTLCGYIHYRIDGHFKMKSKSRASQLPTLS